MKPLTRISGALLTAICLAATLPLNAQNATQVDTVVTVMPKSGAQQTNVPASQVHATLNNKTSHVTDWTPLRGERAGLQMMLLIDNSARSGLSLQFNDLRNFMQRLPADTQVGIAYMQNGRAVIAQNPTTDRKLAGEALHIPQGIPGGSASPYFCLSDLVKNWPAAGNSDRREVLMITDGVDLYYGRRYDPSDPYVQSAITDSQRAGVLVYSIFYSDTGRFDNGLWTQSGAQSYLQQVSQGTGGRAYWQGLGNPVSFAPFLDDLNSRLQNQYELGLAAKPRNKAELQRLKVRVSAPGVKVDAPESVLVPGSESAQR